MKSLLSVGGISSASGSLTIDAGAIIYRVANLLRRADLDAEILWWLNFAQRELTDKINFPELREQGTDIALTGDGTTYQFDLPTDFAKPSRYFFKNTSASPVYGYNLKPLPRAFLTDGEMDFERLLNSGTPSTGDPIYYFIDGTESKLIIWPIPVQAGIIEQWYYKLPADMLYVGDVPSINARWRQYLIPLTYFWGMILTEKDPAAIPLIAFYEKKKKDAIDDLQRLVRGTENVIETYDLPDVGLEDADQVY